MYLIERTVPVNGFKKILMPDDYTGSYNLIHNFHWLITIYAKSRELNANGMVEDFEYIEKQVKDNLEGKYLNELEDLRNASPTEENMAKWICDTIPQCYKVRIVDTDNHSVTEYIEEDF